MKGFPYWVWKLDFQVETAEMFYYSAKLCVVLLVPWAVVVERSTFLYNFNESATMKTDTTNSLKIVALLVYPCLKII